MLILLLVVAVFTVDRLAKVWVNRNIGCGSYREIIKNKLYLTNVKNDGAAYGLFAGNRKLLLGATVFSFAALGVMFRDVVKKGGAADRVSFALILGGGLGNLYDRIRHRGVTDFIYIKFKKAPVFNIADMAIFIGFLAMILRSFRKTG